MSNNQILAGWETMVKSTINVTEETQANISVSELPLTTTESGDQVSIYCFLLVCITFY